MICAKLFSAYKSVVLRSKVCARELQYNWVLVIKCVRTEQVSVWWLQNEHQAAHFFSFYLKQTKWAQYNYIYCMCLYQGLSQDRCTLYVVNVWPNRNYLPHMPSHAASHSSAVQYVCVHDSYTCVPRLLRKRSWLRMLYSSTCFSYSRWEFPKLCRGDKQLQQWCHLLELPAGMQMGQ